MRRVLCLLSVLAACAGNPTAVANAFVDPALRLHGHNDYLQPVPCTRALELGLGSIEADIYLVDGELRVGHERWQLRPGRTLQSLYLEPLRAAVAQGTSLRADGEPLVLLVDIKADGPAVYEHLQDVLLDYRSMLTRFVDGRVEPGAVTILLSGSRPKAQVAAQRDRWCALDGRFDDLDATPAPGVDLVPWVSASWRSVSDWSGSDELLTAELQRVMLLCTKAHQQGRKIRFWGAPDRREAWRAFYGLGIDCICSDQPKQAAKWLREQYPAGAAPRAITPQ